MTSEVCQYQMHAALIFTFTLSIVERGKIDILNTHLHDLNTHIHIYMTLIHIYMTYQDITEILSKGALNIIKQRKTNKHDQSLS